MDNPRIHQGANNPPPDDPFDAFQAHFSDLLAEAINFLDGSGIKSEGEAEAVAKLLDMIRTASKDADKARVEEKRPHDDAAKSVQAKWKPLLDRAELAASTCKKALTPWLQRQDAERQAKAAAARAEANRLAAEAEAAIAAARETDLAAKEQAEAALASAKRADQAATKVEGSRSNTKGGARAVGLRTTYHPKLIEPSLALAHYAKTRPDALKGFLIDLATADYREGRYQIPGFIFTTEQTAI